MTVQLTRDQDPPQTGLPDAGTDTKVFPGPTLAHAEVTREPVGSGDVVEADYSVPLIVTPSSDTVDAGDTLTVNGSGLAANGTGTLELIPGAPGTDGTAVVSVPVTADATGAIPETELTVPAGTDDGAYHLVLSGGAVVVDNTSVTVGGGTPGEASITPDKSEVDSSGDEAARTITVAGTGFPASTAGTVFVSAGGPGTGGDQVGTPAEVTTDASGAFTGAVVVIPEGTAAGAYHIVATVDVVTSDDTPLTITSGAGAPAIVADKDSVDGTGDETERTVTVAGSGFPANTAGTVSIMTGAPGSGGTTVGTPADVTTDATGAFLGAAVIVPEGTAAGDYHIVATVGDATSDDTALTVTGAEPVPTVIPGTTTVAAGSDLTVAGTGFPVSTAGHVGLYDDADAEVGTGVDVTTDAAGEFAGETLTVPAGTTAGTYQLRGTVDTATSADVAITVTAGEPVQLAAPANVAAGTPTATEVPLTWDAVDGATAYRIESSTDGTTWTADATEPTEPSGSATGLTAATEYQLRVTALGDGTATTDSDPSAVVTATTAAAEAAAAKRTAKKK